MILNLISMALDVEMGVLINWILWALGGIGVFCLLIALLKGRKGNANVTWYDAYKSLEVRDEVMSDMFYKMNSIRHSTEARSQDWYFTINHCKGLVIKYDHLFDRYYIAGLAKVEGYIDDLQTLVKRSIKEEKKWSHYDGMYRLTYYIDLRDFKDSSDWDSHVKVI